MLNAQLFIDVLKGGSMIEIPESVETWEETEKTIGETLPVI